MKGGGDYCRIGLVEVVWKAVTVILNRRLTAYINYYKSLYGFRAGRGMGTAINKVILLQQVTAMKEEVVHTIFLDL